MVGTVDPERNQKLTDALLATTEKPFARECLLPRDAAVRQRTSSLFVACLGIDSLLELDARVLDPFRAERRRFPDLPPGPDGTSPSTTGAVAPLSSRRWARL